MLNFDQILNHFMRILASVLGFLLVPVALLTGASDSVMELYGRDAIVAERHDYVFDNDRLLLGAYNNGLSANYDSLPPLAKQAGLDFFVSHVNEDFLDLCQQSGIGVIAKNYNAPTSFMSFTDDVKAQWMGLSMESYKAHPALWGDDCVDEPWTEHMATIGDAVAHHNSLNTGRLPYVNLLPIHADKKFFAEKSLVPTWMRVALPLTGYCDDQLDMYRQHVGEYLRTIDTDYISFDIYPYNDTETHDDWLHNLDILAEACRETNRDLWVITQAAGNVVHKTDGGNKRWCDQKYHQLQQGYASMAFGAKAIVYACFQDGWWDAESHMVTADGQPTDTYYAVQAANAEFAPFAKLYGAYQWRGAYQVNSLRVAGTRYPEFSNGLPGSARLPVQSKDGLLVGCFDAKQGAGKAYILANMNELLEEKTAECSVSFPEGKKVTVYGGGEIKEYANGGKIDFTLMPGDGRFVTVD